MENQENPAWTTQSSGDSFLKTWEADTTNIYNDFFQETSDGNISIGPKAQKSGLEVATSILGYIVPIAVFFWAVGAGHIFLRTQEKSTFAENYQFLCPYLNYGITLPDNEEKGCRTITMIADEYEKKEKELQEQIIAYLTEYIPIKVSQNIMDASPERKFIFDTFQSKVFVDKIMDRFELEKKAAQYPWADNIICNGITITQRDRVSTQCTIYGGNIGDDDSNRKLWSARIEALRFIERISNTAKSQFIVLNPPTTLNIEMAGAEGELVSNLFKTRTTLQLELQYVPLDQIP